MRWRVVLAVPLLGLTGCYNIITLNVGGVQKQAAGTGVPPPPEIECVALMQGIEITAGDTKASAVKLCDEIVKKKAK